MFVSGVTLRIYCVEDGVRSPVPLRDHPCDVCHDARLSDLRQLVRQKGSHLRGPAFKGGRSKTTPATETLGVRRRGESTQPRKDRSGEKAQPLFSSQGTTGMTGTRLRAQTTPPTTEGALQAGGEVV